MTSAEKEGGSPGRAGKGRARAAARAAARLGAVQALYQMDVSGAPLERVLEEFSTRRIGEDFDAGQCGAPDEALLRAIVRGVVGDQTAIDRAVNRHLSEKWKLPRLDATVRAILRAAGFEMLNAPGTPPRVIISEYVDVARAFHDGGDEPGFVNGVLDALARERRAEELHAPRAARGSPARKDGA